MLLVYLKYYNKDLDHDDCSVTLGGVSGTMKHKKVIIIVLSCIAAVAIFVICIKSIFIFYLTNLDKNDPLYIAKKTGLDLSMSEAVSSKSSGSSFHGDGVYLTVLMLDTDFEEKNSDKLDEWNELPMGENMSILCYGGSIGNSYFSYEFLKKEGLPEFTNGFYYFMNFNEDSQNVLYSNLRDFCITIYDGDSHKLYYYEFHS